MGVQGDFMNKKTTLTIVLLLSLGAILVFANDRLSFSHVEMLENAAFVELQLELSLAETTIKVGSDDVLIDFSGEYDEDYEEPTIEVDRDDGSAYILIESGESRMNLSTDDLDASEFNVKLSPIPEYAILCDVGLGDNYLDLTGLKIKQFNLDAGLAETELVIDEPNELTAERVDIDCGLGSIESDHLGYLRFERLTVDAGMGDVNLDLRGYEGEGTVDISVGMGSCDIIVPRGVGVKVFSDGGFMSSIDLEDMDKVSKNVWESEDFEIADHTLEIDLSVGMGSVDLYWK